MGVRARKARGKFLVTTPILLVVFARVSCVRELRASIIILHRDLARY